MFITGNLRKINDYKKLIIRITKADHDKLQAAGAKAWSHVNDDGVEEYFVRVNLDKYDKNLIEKKFEPLKGADVVMRTALVPFEYTDEDGVPQSVKYVLLKSIGRKKTVAVAANEAPKLEA